MSSVNEAVRLFWNYLNSLEYAERNEARCILADFLEENNYSELSGVLKNKTGCSVYYLDVYTDNIDMELYRVDVVTRKIFKNLCDDVIQCVSFSSKLEAAQWQNGFKDGCAPVDDDRIVAVSLKRKEIVCELLDYLAENYCLDVLLQESYDARLQ